MAPSFIIYFVKLPPIFNILVILIVKPVGNFG